MPSCSFFNDKSWIAVDTFPASPHRGGVQRVGSHRPRRAADLAAVLRCAATVGGQRFLGDYIGVTASATTAHAVWCLSARPRLGAPGPLHQIALSATFTR